MIATLTLNPTVDESTTIGQVVPERKLRLEEPVREPGGGGLNVARAARELGAEAVAVFTQGGHTGALLGEILAAEQLPSSPVRVRGATRTSLIVLESATGLQYRFGFPGPELDARELDDCVGTLLGLEPAPAFIVASGSNPPGVPPGFHAHLVREAARRGVRVVVDTSGEPLRQTLGSGVFLVKPNLRELESLTGRALETEEEIETAACRLVSDGAAEVVLASLGAGGAVLSWSGGCERIHAPLVPVRSKVGAGDSSVAGFVVALERGFSVPDAARYAIAAGAAAVMTGGTQLCRRGDVERLYREVHHATPRAPTD